jgi:hypothetical protein
LVVSGADQKEVVEVGKVEELVRRRPRSGVTPPHRQISISISSMFFARSVYVLHHFFAISDFDFFLFLIFFI